jgi:hypothetical protein
MSSSHSPPDHQEPTRNDSRQRTPSPMTLAIRDQPGRDLDRDSDRDYVDNSRGKEGPHPGEFPHRRVDQLRTLYENDFPRTREPRTRDPSISILQSPIPGPFIQEPPIREPPPRAHIRKPPIQEIPIPEPSFRPTTFREPPIPETSIRDISSEHIQAYYQTGEGVGDVERLLPDDSDDEGPRRPSSLPITSRTCPHQKMGKKLNDTSNPQVAQRGQCACGREKIPKVVT